MLNKESTGFISHVAVLLLIAAIFRGVAYFNLSIINIDGIVYIQQARAIYFNQLQDLFASYEYLSNYTLLIAAAYHFIGNWVLSAQVISLFFSVLTVVPLYFLCLNCWDKNRAWFLTLLYVVSPAFVSLSPTVIRGPEFWFFYTSGLLAFSINREKKDFFSLAVALFAFLLATWSRIEGVLPLLLIVGWCLFESLRRKQLRWLLISLLSVVFFIVFLGALAAYFGIEYHVIFDGLSNRICCSFGRFISLKEVLRQLSVTPPDGIVPSFFVHVKRFLWFLAAGVTGRSILKAFSLPVLSVWLFGTVCGRKINLVENKTRTFAAAGFFFVLFVAGLLLLYSQVLLNWSSSSRFTALVYFPGLILLGRYLSPLVIYLKRWLRCTTFRSYLVLALLVTLFSLPGILREGHGKSRLPLKEIGLALAEKRQPGEMLKVWGTIRALRDVHFYAHLSETTAPSVWQDCRVLKLSELNVDTLKQFSYDYLLVVEKDGSRQRLLKLQTSNPDLGLTALQEINSKKYGLISLFGRDFSTAH